jgi:hypothetical protein
MNKIPMGAVIGGAYGFAFRRFFGVIGVVWLPVALSIAAAYFLFRDIPAPPAQAATAQETLRNFTTFYVAAMGPLGIMQLVMWAAGTMIEVGLTRLALGIGRAPFAFFTLGGTFWRLLIANLIVTVIVVIVMLPLMVVSMAVAGLAGAAAGQGAAAHEWIDPSAAPWIAALLVALFFATFIAILYLNLRLWFFLAPVVVAENHMDIRHGWRMAKGNVLRIFGILLAVVLPFVFILLAAEGGAVVMMLAHRWTTFPDAQFFIDRWPQFAAIGAVVLLAWLLVTAALCGARALAYRALIPAEAAVED